MTNKEPGELEESIRKEVPTSETARRILSGTVTSDNLSRPDRELADAEIQMVDAYCNEIRRLYRETCENDGVSHENNEARRILSGLKEVVSNYL